MTAAAQVQCIGDNTREGRAPRRILLIKPSSLGDIVHTLPVLSLARRAYPQAHIAWLVNAGFAPLLEGHPLLDEVIVFDRRQYGRMLRNPRAALAFARFARGLRARRFDLVIDLQGLFRSGFLSWISSAPRRVGFAAAREFAWLFYTQCVRPPRAAVHAVDKNVCLAHAALPGAAHIAAEFPLGLSAAELHSVEALLGAAAGRPLPHFIAILPAARWDTKRWPAARFAELIEQLAAEGSPPAVLLGAPDERPIADEILARCRAPAIDLVGRTSLRALAAVLALADLVISNDSGPMHLAAALGRPLIAIFGPTDPARTGPYDSTAVSAGAAAPADAPAAITRVASLDLSCAPCYRRRCPLVHHNCLRQLTVEHVLRSVRELAAASARGTDRGAQVKPPPRSTDPISIR